jgi:hypothetical protein
MQSILNGKPKMPAPKNQKILFKKVCKALKLKITLCVHATHCPELASGTCYEFTSGGNTIPCAVKLLMPTFSTSPT